MKHVNTRRHLRGRAASVLAMLLAAGGLTVVSASPSSAATPSSGERIVSWKKVPDSASTGHIERAADVIAPTGARFVKAFPNSGSADGVVALTDQHKVVVGGTAELAVPTDVLSASVSDLTTDGSTAYAAVTQSGTVYAWNASGSVESPTGTCAATTASVTNVVIAVVCQNGSVEFFPMKGQTVPAYYSLPSTLDGVTDIVLTNMGVGSGNVSSNVAIAVNSDGQAIRWGENISGSDSPPRTAGKKLATVERQNGLTTTGSIVSYSTQPRHDIPTDDGGLDPTIAAAGFVSVTNSGFLGQGITTSGKYASWGDNGGFQLSQVLRPLPSGLSDTRFVSIAANANRVAAIVADTDAPSGPQVSTPSTISGATGGLVTPGSTLSGTPATFSGTVGTTTTDWLADGVVIASATGSLTLPITSAMVDQDITFRTRATGGSLTAPLDSVSAPVTVAGAAPHTVVTPSTISGGPASGLYLTGTPATFDTTPDTVSTRWLVDGVEATQFRNMSDLLLTDAMVGQKVTFSTRASWDADDGAAPTVSTSEPTPAIRVALEGTAVIKGEPIVGQTLTVDIDWTDNSPDLQVNGYWVHNDDYAPIAEGTSYTLTKADIGKTIDWLGEGSRFPEEAGSTNATTDFVGVGPVVAAQLTITGEPTISGSPVVGGTLTAAPAPVSDDEADVTLTWFVDGEDTGETGTTYEPTSDDIGKTVTVKQVASVDGATSGINYASAESAATTQVAERPADLKIESQATLSGTPLEGKTLTGTPAEFSPTEDVTVTNYWVIDGDQGSAGGTTLALTADQVGKSIQFRSIAKRGDDRLSSTSEAVGPVIAKLASTSTPRIEGSPIVGQTLNGIPGGFSASEGVTRTNFWVVNGTQQPAEGGLVLTDELEGKTIAFRSVATRGDESVIATSDPVGPVTKPAPPEPVAEVKVLLDGPTKPGATFSVRVGKDFADETVSASTNDPQRQLGEHKVDSDGNIKVTLPGDMPLGNQTLTVQEGSKTLGSDAYTVTLTRPEGEAGKDKIAVTPATVRTGQVATVTFEAEHVGEQARLVAFSDPTDIGFKPVASNGGASIVVPASLQVGVHRMAAYATNGDLIGYGDFTVAAEVPGNVQPQPGVSDPGGKAPGNGTPLDNSPGNDVPWAKGQLPATGSDVPEYAAAAGLLMVLIGLALVSGSRGRRRPARRAQV